MLSVIERSGCVSLRLGLSVPASLLLWGWLAWTLHARNCVIEHMCVCGWGGGRVLLESWDSGVSLSRAAVWLPDFLARDLGQVTEPL